MFLCDNCGIIFLFQAGVGQLYSLQCTGNPSLAEVARIQCVNVPASTDDDTDGCSQRLVALATARDQVLFGTPPPDSLPIPGVSQRHSCTEVILAPKVLVD